MAVFSGTGFVGMDSELASDEVGNPFMVLYVRYSPRTDQQKASWVEVVARGAIANALNFVAKGALVEFHLSDLRIVKAINKDGKALPKLTGDALALKVIA